MIEVTEQLEDEVKETVRLATSYAVDFFGAKSPEDIEKIERKLFITKCHEGFDLAQDRIVKNLIELESQLKVLNQKIKNAEKGKKQKELKSDEEYPSLLKERKKVHSIAQCFRRIADTIVWQILDMNRVLIRSTVIGEDHHGYLEDKNLSSALDTIKQLKKPGDFYLITDLTSCLGAGSGDLLHIDVEQNWRFIELKTGPVNIEVTEFMEALRERAESGMTNSGQAPEEILRDPKNRAFFDKYGHMFEKGKKEHVERFLRQMGRLYAVQEYEHKNIGKEIALTKGGKEKGRIKRAFIPHTEDRHAFNEVDRMLAAVSDNPPTYFGFLDFSDFLTLLITDNTKSKIFSLELSPFVREMNARHMIHHHIRGDIEQCKYVVGSSKKLQGFDEFKSYADMPLIEWGNQIVGDASLMPPFLMGLTHEYVYDILFGRKSIFAYFDRHKFAEYVSAAGGKILEAKATDHVTHEWAGIQVKLSPDAKEPGELGWGMILRMIVEFQEPQTIVDQMVDVYESRLKQHRRDKVN